jgi:Zn-dependent protease
MPETTAAVDRAAQDIPLTRSARDALEHAVAEASRRNEPEATPVDVLRAVLGARGSLADETVRGLGVDPDAVIASIPPDGATPALPLRQLVVNANREATVLGHYQVDAIHLLLVLMYSDARQTASVLQAAGLTLYDVRRHMQTGVRAGNPVTSGSTPATRDAAMRAAATRAPDRALRRRPLPSLSPVLGVSPMFLGLVALTVISGGVLWFGVLPQALGILTIVFVVAGWVVTVCVHEFFHAVVAYLGGDRDVAVSGYLTLNPLKYTNIVMSIAFPVIALLLGGFGLPGGAVYINHAALRSKSWDSLVSVAGPVANALFALLIAAVLALALHLDWVTTTNLPFFEAFGFLGFVEVFAVFLNLLPIPPLDGFGIIRPWLPYSVQSTAVRMGSAGILVVFLLLFYVPAVGGALFSVVGQLTFLIGIDPSLVALGQQHMRLR